VRYRRRLSNVPMITIAKMISATMPSPIDVAKPPGSSPAADEGGSAKMITALPPRLGRPVMSTTCYPLPDAVCAAGPGLHEQELRVAEQQVVQAGRRLNRKITDTNFATGLIWNRILRQITG
jgi:hypothetical protein